MDRSALIRTVGRLFARTRSRADSDEVVAQIIVDAVPGVDGAPQPQLQSEQAAASQAARRARDALASDPERTFCEFWSRWWRAACARSERAARATPRRTTPTPSLPPPLDEPARLRAAAASAALRSDERAAVVLLRAQPVLAHAANVAASAARTVAGARRAGTRCTPADRERSGPPPVRRLWPAAGRAPPVMAGNKRSRDARGEEGGVCGCGVASASAPSKRAREHEASPRCVQPRLRWAADVSMVRAVAEALWGGGVHHAMTLSASGDGGRSISP